MPSRVREEAYSPYFSIQTRLAFGLASLGHEPSDGSLSFGPKGFSIVRGEGRQWDKIEYRDLNAARLEGDSVRLVVRDVDSVLTIYPRGWLSWLKPARRKRAALFLELLSKVKNGLTPTEIGMYQRKLQ